MALPIQDSNELSIKPRLWELIQGLPEEQAKKLFNKLQAFVPKNQRKHPRVACDMPVDYTSQKGSFAGFIKDISKGGVFIETGADIDIGEKIKMVFSAPNQPKPIKVAGRVVRKNILGVGIKIEKTKEMADQSTWLDCRRNMAETSKERRLDPRVDLQCPVYIDGIRDAKTITDLSIGGVFIECDSVSRNKFRIGQLITLDIKLPTENDMLPVKAQVVNYNDRGMHCKFAHLGRKTEDAIFSCFNMTKHTIPIK
jgi:Tfp pilus assembly protein PilZ